jgi:hypothetical protein
LWVVLLWVGGCGHKSFQKCQAFHRGRVHRRSTQSATDRSAELWLCKFHSTVAYPNGPALHLVLGVDFGISPNSISVWPMLLCPSLLCVRASYAPRFARAPRALSLSFGFPSPVSPVPVGLFSAPSALVRRPSSPASLPSRSLHSCASRVRLSGRRARSPRNLSRSSSRSPSRSPSPALDQLPLEPPDVRS